MTDKDIVQWLTNIITKFIEETKDLFDNINQTPISKIKEFCVTWDINYNNVFPEPSNGSYEKIFPQEELTTGKVDVYAKQEGLMIDDIIKHWPGEYKIILKRAHIEGLNTGTNVMDHYNKSFFNILLNNLNNYLKKTIGVNFQPITPDLLYFYILPERIPAEYLVQTKEEFKAKEFKLIP